MKRAAVLAILVWRTGASPVLAADLELGARYFRLQPSDTGTLDLRPSMGFAATADVFWTEYFSTQLAASFAQPQAILFPEPNRDVDLGSLGIEPLSLTARYHIRPRSRIVPFIGAGGALVVIGNLEDFFDDDVEVDFDREKTFVAEAGVRYRSTPHLTFEASLSRYWLTATPKIRKTNVDLPSPLKIDPLLAGLGVSWRF